MIANLINYIRSLWSTVLISTAILAGLGTQSIFAQEIGKGIPAPSFTALIANKQSNLSDYRGKIVLIDFWASWCQPCQKSLPFLNTLQSQFNEKHFQILAINVDENSDEGRSFIQTHHIALPVIYDPKGKLAELFALKTMPTSVLIDQNGIVQEVYDGFHEKDKSVITDDIKRLLNTEDKHA